MALLLRSKQLLNRAKRHLEHDGPARSGAIMATAAGVGLYHGKKGNLSNKSLAIDGAVGAGLKLLGFNTIGDGTLASAATMLGYRHGAKSQVATAAALPPTAPAPAPRMPMPAGKRRA